MGTALRFKFTQVPRQAGELARLKVVKGPDYGAMYVITGRRASIGRGEENDVILSDLRASRIHAELVQTDSGWEIRDAGSVNGILHNGAEVKSAKFNYTDTVTLGETTLEFVSSELATQVLMAPAKTLEQVDADQRAVQARDDRIKSLRSPAKAGPPGTALSPAKMGGASGMNPRTLAIVAVGVALFFIVDGEDKTPGKGKRKPASLNSGESQGTDFAAYLPESEIANINRSAEMFYKAGYREYRQGNWMRAKVQFETVRQIQPNHSMAMIYIQNCDKNIEREVNEHLGFAKKDFDAGKLKSSKGHLDAVKRLLFRSQSDEKYKEAEDLLTQVNKKLELGGAT